MHSARRPCHNAALYDVQYVTASAGATVTDMDMMAMAAMQGLLANETIETWHLFPDRLAVVAYQIAEAMETEKCNIYQNQPMFKVDAEVKR